MTGVYVFLGSLFLLAWVAGNFAYWWDFSRPFKCGFNWRVLVAHRWYRKWYVAKGLAYLLEVHGGNRQSG